MANPRIVVYEDFPPTLSAAQHFVGGYVQLVALDRHTQMLVNEEGLVKGLPLNPLASIMAGCTIVGDVVLLKGKGRWS